MLKNNVSQCKELFMFDNIPLLDIIHNFKTLERKKTGDLWGISINVLHSIINDIALSLAIIFNKSIKKGVFSGSYKI